MVLFALSATMGRAQNGGADDAAAVARDLANPNATRGSLGSLVDLISYRGDLPDADGQLGIRFSFQPSLPYPVAEGVNLFLRPLVPLVVKQPVFGENGFEDRGVALGDIVVDAALGKTWKSGWVTLVGVFASLPTATDDALGSGSTALGPEALLGKMIKGGFLGVLVNNSWSLDGDGPTVTGGQYFYTVNLKNAWQIKAQPTFSYVHDQPDGQGLSFPLGTGLAKTVVLGKTPVQLNAQYWYFVASPDLFGAAHQLRLQITPVVKLPW